MKNNAAWFIVFCILVLGVSGCASKQNLIKQSRDSRRVAEAYMVKGDFTEALRYLLQAESIWPDDHLLQDDLGKAYVARERYDLAIKHFKRCLELQPDYSPGKNNLGSAYLLAERWDEAIAMFDDLKDDLLYATPHYPLYNLGWAYYNKGDYPKAVDFFNQSLKSMHNFVLPLRGLGLTYLKTGDLDRSISYFKKAVEQTPRFAQLHMDLGATYALKKDYTSAIEAYETAASLQPNTPLADQAGEEVKRLKAMNRK
ncbi:tetratricopeptide repeat protein [Desulfatiferula olefinivorans]